jgi:predicted N-formylglutamate amidohydrolase
MVVSGHTGAATDSASAASLLDVGDPPAACVERAAGNSPFVLICDHAGSRIPRALGDLGVSAAERQRHIAWDIGAAGLARALAVQLDAFLVTQTYSRLVIDCNRPLDAAGSIVTRSERTDIPGNVALDDTARRARIEAIFLPYHAAIATELDRRAALGVATLLVSVHSFTPVYEDVARPWHIGVLYQRDVRAAHALLRAIRTDGRWAVGDNEPYAVSDASDYAIPVHGEKRGIAHIELEVRQDLIADVAGQLEWAGRVAGWLRQVPAHIDLGAIPAASAFPS